MLALFEVSQVLAVLGFRCSALVPQRFGSSSCPDSAPAGFRASAAGLLALCCGARTPLRLGHCSLLVLFSGSAGVSACCVVPASQRFGCCSAARVRCSARRLQLRLLRQRWRLNAALGSLSALAFAVLLALSAEPAGFCSGQRLRPAAVRHCLSASAAAALFAFAAASTRQHFGRWRLGRCVVFLNRLSHCPDPQRKSYGASTRHTGRVRQILELSLLRRPRGFRDFVFSLSENEIERRAVPPVVRNSSVLLRQPHGSFDHFPRAHCVLFIRRRGRVLVGTNNRELGLVREATIWRKRRRLGR